MHCRRYLILFVVLLSAACSTKTSVRHIPEYEKTINKYENLLILPPAAEVNTVDMVNKKERMYDYEAHLEGLLANELAPLIRDKGFRVDVLRNRDIHNKKLTGTLLNLRRNYNAIREELYVKPVWKKEDAFAISKNVGPSAIELGKKTNSDILLMVDYANNTKTSGARLMKLASGMMFGSYADTAAENLVMILGMIDARNGDILWTNMSSHPVYLLSSIMANASDQDQIDIKRLNKLISDALKELKGKDN